MPLLQLWLGIEQVQLAGRPFHIQEDDVFRLSRKMWRFGSERIQLRCPVGGAPFVCQEISQCDRPDPAARAAEKIAPAQSCSIALGHDYSRLFPRDEAVGIQ